MTQAQKTQEVTTSKRKEPRSAALDGMKGLMILAIIFYYYFQNYLPGGFLAVNAFFVFGGYLAFRSNKPLFHQKKTHYHLPQKISRLWIPMVWMIVVVVAVIFIAAPEHLMNLRYMALSSLAFVNNDYQILNQQSYFVQYMNPSPFVHLWYVSLYLQLMLIAVGIRKMFARSNLLRMQESLVLMGLGVISAVAMAVLYWWEQDPSHVYYLVTTRMFSFVFGGALSYFFDGRLSLPLQGSVSSKISTQLFGGISAGLLVLMMMYFNGTQAATYYIGMQVFTLVTLLFLISGLYENTMLNYFLRFRGFTALGRRSYSYYLWFYPVHLLAPSWVLIEQKWLSFAVQFIVIALLAEISYRVFELQQWKIPFGQKVSLSSIRDFLSGDLPPVKRIFGITFSFLYVILAGVSLVGFAQSAEGTNESAQQLEEKIKQNQELVTQTTEATTMDETQKLEIRQQVAQRPVTFVGDSILLAAADKIQELFPNATIDGKVGRQLYSSRSVLTDLLNQGKINDVVVTVLGTNGTFSQTQLDDYIQALGTNRQLYFVTIEAPVTWKNEVNQQFQEATTRYANVHLIDWSAQAGDHPDWFYEDHIHPNTDGATQLAEYILARMTAFEIGE